MAEPREPVSENGLKRTSAEGQSGGLLAFADRPETNTAEEFVPAGVASGATTRSEGRKGRAGRRAMAKDIETTGVSQSYINARVAWDERYGDLIGRAQNWRAAFFAMTGVAALVGGSLLYEMHRSYVVPFVVAVDSLNNVVGEGFANESSVADPRLVRSRLLEYVEDTRSVSSDPLVMRGDITKAFDMTANASPAENFLKQFYTTESPFEKTETTQVEVHNIASLTPTSYELTWTETNRDKVGNVTSKQEWKGVLGILIAPPKDEVTARRNPLGIYVTTITWSRSV